MKRTCALPGCTIEFDVKEDVERYRNTKNYCCNEHSKLHNKMKMNERYHTKVKLNKKLRKQFFL